MNHRTATHGQMVALADGPIRGGTMAISRGTDYYHRTLFTCPRMAIKTL